MIEASSPLHAALSEPTQAPAESAHELERVAQQFEAIFVRQLLAQMQPADEQAGGNPYAGMGQEAFAEHMTTQSCGFGIAHTLLKHWGIERGARQGVRADTTQENI